MLIAGGPAISAHADSPTPQLDLASLPANISTDSPEYAALVDSPGFHYAPATKENLAKIAATDTARASVAPERRSLGSQVTPLITAGKCNYNGRADNPHISGNEASVHGSWVVLSGTCPATAKVTADLQAVGCTPFGCVWINQTTASGVYYAGGGSGNWATPHKICANAKIVGWRGRVDVDLTGVNDPSGYQYSTALDLACSPA